MRCAPVSIWSSTAWGRMHRAMTTAAHALLRVRPAAHTSVQLNIINEG